LLLNLPEEGASRTTGPCGLGGLFGVCCAWPLEVEDQQKQIDAKMNIVDRDDDGEIESPKSKQATSYWPNLTNHVAHVENCTKNLAKFGLMSFGASEALPDEFTPDRQTDRSKKKT
jgi:hypothetical protein